MAQPLKPEELHAHLEPLIQELNPEVYLVAVRAQGKNLLQLLVDTDEGIHLNNSTKLNRGLRNWLETCPEDHPLRVLDGVELEVSSPGLGEPLRLNRQYKRHLGRQLKLHLQDGQQWVGKLLEVQDEGILLDTHAPDPDKPRKKVPVQKPFTFSEIDKAWVEATL